MKKLLLSLSAIALLAAGTQAQTAPDLGFETWNAIAPPFITIKDPAGWASLNALTVTGTPQSVFQETSSVAAGTSAAKIVTVKIASGTTIPNPYGGNLDTAGILGVGKINTSPPGFTYGYTFAAKPGVLTFQSKYTPVGNDSAFVLIYLTHWNTSVPAHRDTVATGKYGTGAATSAYAMQSITVNYKPAFMTVVPDSEQIFISASVYAHDGAQIGSTFYVDALAWSAFVSTNDIDAVKGSVTAYPNPGNSRIAIASTVDAKAVMVMDITGRVIGSYDMNANTAEIETSEFAAGVYTYMVIDNNKLVINRGKFDVAH
jgi:hypothetical protein